MSRNRPLTKPEDGVCSVTGLDVPGDGDGQLVRFPEKTGRVITRQMVKTGARGGDILAETPQSALLNVIKALGHEIERAENPNFKGFDATEANRLLSTARICLDCLADHDLVGLQAHLRSKGFLCRIGQ